MSLDSKILEIAKVFFEESRDGLDLIERALLHLEAGADKIQLDTIFRAAHSIKGGAGTFGHGDIAVFTHGVETLLDRMRTGLQPITTQLVQTLLQACDFLRDMIAAAESGESYDHTRAALLSGAVNSAMTESALPPLPPQSVAPAADMTPIAGWRIRFEPVRNLLQVRNEPTRMFAELAKLGRFSAQADLSSLPDLPLMAPADCYLKWRLELWGDIPRAQLDEVFDWCDPGCQLEFEPVYPSEPVVAAATYEPAPRLPRRAPAKPVESTLSRAPPDSASIRVATDRLDTIINLVGELVITQSMLGRFFDGTASSDLESLRLGLLQLARNTRELQESVMHVRMLPISFAFNRLPRLVHDLTIKLGKSVDLRLVGESTEIDKTVLEKLTDPLVHLVRNALDHGLETPHARRQAGKPETGRLEIAAFHDGGNIIVEVRDDGAGLNSEKIRRKALDRGLLQPNQELSAEQLHDLIFSPGFSTADQVSDISGRGVGMDVVRRNINDLGGQVSMSSRAGNGSTVRIRLPLTLAILDGQLVRVGNEVYVIPLLSIVESVQVGVEQLNYVGPDVELFRLRGAHLPVIKLCDVFDVRPDSHFTEDGLLVVVESDGSQAGVLIDELLSQQQVVIKSLETNFRQVDGLSGATILGDGRVALIVDAPSLMKKTGAMSRRHPAKHAAWRTSQPTSPHLGQLA